MSSIGGVGRFLKQPALPGEAPQTKQKILENFVRILKFSNRPCASVFFPNNLLYFGNLSNLSNLSKNLSEFIEKFVRIY
jgi:hypothetical protein